MNDIPRYNIYVGYDWIDGDQIEYLEVDPSRAGEWVRWEDVEELIKKNERTKDPGQSGTGQSELRKD